MSGELRTAIGHVGDLKTAVDGLPKTKRVAVTVTGAGSGTITFAQQIAGQNAKGYLAFHSRGARIPGYGGGDQHPALLEGGEAVVPKHLTPAVAPFLRAHGVPGFAAGGLIGAGSVLNTGEPWMGARETSAGYAAASSFGRGILNNMHQLAARASAATGAGLGGAGVARWAPLILKVLAMIGQSSANLGAVEHRMAQESGGNPYAINLTDINARMGDPSRGLMQTIMSTFQRYRSFSLPNDIYNPEANIFAGLNYAVNAYAPRSLSSVMLQAGGYDQGGFLPTGLSLAYNGTGRPEPVGHGSNYYITVNMPFGSTRAEVENGLVKALDSLKNQRRLPRVP
jgi:Transglycosylase SLT domain